MSGGKAPLENRNRLGSHPEFPESGFVNWAHIPCPQERVRPHSALGAVSGVQNAIECAFGASAAVAGATSLVRGKIFHPCFSQGRKDFV